MSLSGVAFADETSGLQRAGKVKEENERKMFMMTLVVSPGPWLMTVSNKFPWRLG